MAAEMMKKHQRRVQVFSHTVVLESILFSRHVASFLS